MPSLYSLLFALSHEHSMKFSVCACLCVCPLADIHLKFAERNDGWDPLLALDPLNFLHITHLVTFASHIYLHKLRVRSSRDLNQQN